DRLCCDRGTRRGAEHPAETSGRISRCNRVGNRAEPRVAASLRAADALATWRRAGSWRRIALHAFIPGIPCGWHVRAWPEANYNNRAFRPVPLQPQSDLSLVHPAPDWIVHLVERSLAAGHACSAGRLHLGGGDSTRGAIPGAEFSRVFELQGRCPPLDVGKWVRSFPPPPEVARTWRVPSVLSREHAVGLDVV